MSEVKRYDSLYPSGSGMEENELGSYVKYYDYEHIEHELNYHSDACKSMALENNDLNFNIINLQKQNAILVEAINSIKKIADWDDYPVHNYCNQALDKIAEIWYNLTPYTAPATGTYCVGNKKYLFRLSDSISVYFKQTEDGPEPSSYIERILK